MNQPVTTPRLRNPDIVQAHPVRELLRGLHPDRRLAMPTGKAGLDIADLDLIVTHFGPLNPGRTGQSMRLLEFKHGTTTVDWAGLCRFADIDRLMACHPHYQGFYVVNYDHTRTETLDTPAGPITFPAADVTFTVNQTVQLNRDDFLDWVRTPNNSIPTASQANYPSWNDARRKTRTTDKPSRATELAKHIDELMWLNDYTADDLLDAIPQLWNRP